MRPLPFAPPAPRQPLAGRGGLVNTANVIASELEISRLTNEVQRLQKGRHFTEARQVFQILVAAVSKRTHKQVHELESAKGLLVRSTEHAP